MVSLPSRLQGFAALTLLAAGGCLTMQPVSEPISAYVERERPKRVHLRTATDDSDVVVREPRVRDEILHGYSLIERCEDGRPELRTTCVHQVDSIAVPVEQVLRLSAPRMSGSRTLIAGLGVGVLVGTLIFVATAEPYGGLTVR